MTHMGQSRVFFKIRSLQASVWLGVLGHRTSHDITCACGGVWASHLKTLSLRSSLTGLLNLTISPSCFAVIILRSPKSPPATICTVSNLDSAGFAFSVPVHVDFGPSWHCAMFLPHPMTFRDDKFRFNQRCLKREKVQSTHPRRARPCRR